jgi:hypothetical protein
MLLFWIFASYKEPQLLLMLFVLSGFILDDNIDFSDNSIQ